jgi:hypothetical protein
MGWAEDQGNLLKSLLGCDVESIDAVEEAIRGSEAAGLPKFRDDRFPFLQCVFVELKLGDGRFVVFHTNQADDIFAVGIEVRQATSIEPHWNDSHRDGEPSIHRVAPDLGFSLGRAEGAEARPSDKGGWSEVELSFAGRRVLLKAGEVCEDFSVSELDENILLFLNAEDASSMSYNPPGRWIPIVGGHRG